ncbi:YihY/virulence factor BrkB family protein [Nocardiopsis trehalosi]|jgi:membrane protein|uniref:YihY/virulence factor BrkB family protein n=1 Tax=Nocardiopsis trehalosi TaxID=109329 RepID=UPI000835E2C7|nr:YhjD/YihY/BrkB family envelope integrity protein [Nocardiopsis trehalosi]
MASLTGTARDRARHYGHLAMEAYWAARRRRPGFDHAVRAYERYADRRGDQLAAAVTYYAFLSFFPLVAIAFAAIGYLAAFEAAARAYLERAIAELLPGIAAGLPVEQIADARIGAGIIGVVGLVYSGLGAVAAMREALHQIWLKNVADGPNIVVAKLLDTLVMVVLGAAVLASVALTSVAQAATRWLLGWVGWADSLAAVAATRVLGAAIALAVSMLVFLVLFSRLSGTRRPWRLLWRGALLAAVGFEVLKALGALLISGTLGNPVYASFAVLVGLLVWINIVLRTVLFCAAWTATWLPVPPPYQGTVPVPMPIGPSAAEPVRAAIRTDRGPGGPLPGRPAARRGPRPTRADRLRRAAAPAAAAAAAGAGIALWLRRRRADPPERH